MSKVAFADDVKLDDGDLDDLTNNMLLREKNTYSRAKLQRMKIISVITGNYASRKKVFSEIQEHADYKTYEITILGKRIQCAKVFNPALLEKNSKTWSKLMNVQRFELEDPEGILTSIPKHYASYLGSLESFSITWARVKSLPNEMFREGLKTLILQRNHLKTLNGIEKAVDLSNLDVSSNLLPELPKTFGQLQNLTTLNISGNAIKELPENFGALSQLRMLDCSCNRLNRLPDSIENLIELTSLDVCNNHLVALPESIGNMPKLEDLRARGNQLQLLPVRFERLTRLASLLLGKNKFEEIPRQLSNISSLQNLNMRENFVSSFPRAILSLKTLILDSNQLEEIGDEMLNCSNIQMLSLENNRITSMSEEIRRLKSLRVLHLSGNQIDDIPETIEHLQHLRHLSLRSTKIRRLPMAIVRMDNLVLLDIEDCQNLEDMYLKVELKERGLAGLKEYLGQNQISDQNPPLPDTNILIHTRPKSQMPPNRSVESGSWSSPDDDDQSLQVVHQSRGTIFSPARETVQFANAQHSAGQAILAQLKTSRSGKHEMINLVTIRESQSEDHMEPRDPQTPTGSDVEYGVVVKQKANADKQRLIVESDDAENLRIVDSEVIIRQRLDSKDSTSRSTKRQSKA